MPSNIKTMKQSSSKHINRKHLRNFHGNTHTQKAGGSRKRFIKHMLNKTNIIDLLVNKLRIKLTDKPISTKSASSSRLTKKGNGDKETKSSTLTGGDVTTSMSLNNSKHDDNTNASNTKLQKLDRKSSELYQAVKIYAIGILDKCFRKMSKAERQLTDKHEATTIAAIETYVKDILLWGIDGETTGNNTTILLDPKNSCDYTLIEPTGTSSPTGSNAERLEQVLSLNKASDLASVKSVFQSLLSTERDIVRESKQGTPDMAPEIIRINNDNATKKQKLTAHKEYENKSFAARCNYFLQVGVLAKDIPNALQNKIVTISSMHLNCEGDPVRTGSVFHIIKRSGHNTVSTKLQASDFYIIQTKMQEASCYATDYTSSSDFTGKPKEIREKRRKHEQSHSKLVNLFKEKNTIKNNGLGLLFYVRRTFSTKSD